MSEPVTTATSEGPAYYTFAEALEVLNVSERVLRRAIEDGLIPHVKLGPKTIRIPVDGLREAWTGRPDQEPESR